MLNKLKRYLFTANVTQVEGCQMFYVDAETPEQAEKIMKSVGGTIYSEALSVMDISTPYLDGETSLNDFGDFPPEQAPDALKDVLTAVSIGGSRTELIDALTAIKPNFGAPGSRDVDVRAAHVAIDKAIEKLSNL